MFSDQTAKAAEDTLHHSKSFRTKYNIQRHMALHPDQLRCLVQDCIAKHLYSTAVFYADKLVTLTDYAPGDVYLLAQVSCHVESSTPYQPMLPCLDMIQISRWSKFAWHPHVGALLC